MKKISIALAFTALMHFGSMSQVIIQASIPAVGLVQKNQLWSVLVINSSKNHYRGYLQLRLTDRATGVEILTASSGQFDIEEGAKQLNANLINPIQYSYLSTNFDTRLQGLIPCGSYMVCYQLLNSSAGKTDNLAEECVQFDVEPLSPPILILPSDSSRLENAPTQFSWIPPTPQGIFSNLHYELLITEISEGQKAQEAIQNNVPFYDDGALIVNNMVYPSTFLAFEKEKWYAWQVIAKDDNAYAGKSETWVFKLTDFVKEKKPESDIYLLMQDNNQGKHIVANSTLHVKYFSYDNTYEGIVVFKDENGNVIKNINQKIVAGDNYLDLPLGGQFVNNRIYKIVITDKSGKQHNLTFTINKQ